MHPACSHHLRAGLGLEAHEGRSSAHEEVAEQLADLERVIRTIANNVTVKVGTDGKVCLFTSATTDLIVDINGYHPPV